MYTLHQVQSFDERRSGSSDGGCASSCSSDHSDSTAISEESSLTGSVPTDANQASRHRQSKLAVAARLLLLDAPYTAVLILYAVVCLTHQCNLQYMNPQITELLQWEKRFDRKRNEVTYYKRFCTQADQTTFDAQDLLVPQSSNDTINAPYEDSVQQAYASMLTHGLTIIPNLLSPETAQQLRETILEYNTKVPNYFVLKPDARYSYAIQIQQHPAVQRAVQELTTHAILQPLLERVLGHKGGAIYKFHAITSTTGSVAQDFHWDVIPTSGAGMYARSFVPFYSLFVPLQNTTRIMGATEFCPGTHKCSDGTRFCLHTAVSAVDAAGPDQVWPVGYGALMNQQVTHRGPEHVDPSENSERVVFILAFAPVPRYGQGQQSSLETRALGLGGTYPVHWSQWGHSTFDLQNPAKYMAWPWKYLRSFGLYKRHSEAVWGWDYFTILAVQIANGLFHYNFEDLQERIENWTTENGFLGSMLSHFLAELDEEWSRDGGRVWYAFFEDTLVKSKALLESVYATAFMLYLTGILIVHGSNRQISRSLVTSVARLVIVPTIVGLLFFSATQRIASTPWASHIRSRKLYQLSSDFRRPFLPSVLPLEQDVLILDDYKSEYLASYTELYEVIHDGNARWHRMVQENAAGYSHLNEPLQEQLCENLYYWNRAKKSRILTKNHKNQWAELPYDMALKHTHSQLMRKENKFVDKAMELLEFLSSETKFGTWRDTALHRIHIPSLLESLKHSVLNREHRPSSSEAGTDEISQRFFSRKSNLPILRNEQTVYGRPRRDGIPLSETDIEEPFIGAWLKVGDEIEAWHGDRAWYRAKLIAAHAHQNEWTVMYYDGESDRKMCRQCIRPFVDYGEGEIVEYQSDEDSDNWSRARIVAVHGDDTFDFRHVALTQDDNDVDFVNNEIQTQDIRRLKALTKVPFRLGQQVEALLYDDYDEHYDQWVLATIITVDDDGTYGLEYMMRNKHHHDFGLSGDDICALS